MSPALRYVVLHHTGIPAPHYDLMFETAQGSPLRTFRVPTWPIRDQAPLAPLPDHRTAYLSYEGPVSNNRGVVRRVESGTYEGHLSDDPPFHLLLRSSGISVELSRAGDQWTFRVR